MRALAFALLAFGCSVYPEPPEPSELPLLAWRGSLLMATAAPSNCVPPESIDYRLEGCGVAHRASSAWPETFFLADGQPDCEGHVTAVVRYDTGSTFAPVSGPMPALPPGTDALLLRMKQEFFGCRAEVEIQWSAIRNVAFWSPYNE